MITSTLWKRLLMPTLLTGAMLMPAASAFAETITVKSGDTLGKLAAANGVTVEHLRIANHLKSDTLFVGTSLYIPPKSTIYTVQSGDVLWKLASKYQTTISTIKEINQMTSDSLIVGEKLLLPITSTAPASPAPSVPSSGGTTYTVQSGDVLWKIADKHNVSIASIVEANQLKTYDLLVGQTLVIPMPPAGTQPTPAPVEPAPAPPAPAEGTVYTVVKGDVLWKIAERYQVSILDIAKANKLASLDLMVGQKLIIPAPGTATPAPEAPAKPAPPAEQPVPPATEEPQAKPETPAPVEEEPPQDEEASVDMIAYTVQKGDNPWSISIAHGIPMSEFLKVNNLSASSYLSIGQVVKIPVHRIPEMETPGDQYGEYLDWFEAAQYLFPINAVAEVTDFYTGKTFMAKRTIGAFHSDTEPLTAADSAIIKEIWGGSFSWKVRPVIVNVDGRKIAASMSSMPHDIEYIKDNDFDGHFDIHFLNSLRHKDGAIDPSHQNAIKVAAGLN